MLTLYFAPGSSSMAPHIALHEIGQPFETKLISLASKDQRDPAYLAVNPEGKVPALVIDQRPALTEVAGILFYLAKAFPSSGLLPPGIEAEARAVSWMSFIASALHPARRRGLDHAMGLYRIADERLGDRDWVLGSYSIADIHLFRLYWRMIGSLHPPAGSFPRLDAHLARMLERPAVRRTIEVESAIGYEFPQA